MLFQYSGLLLSSASKLVSSLDLIRDSLVEGKPVRIEKFLHPGFAEALQKELEDPSLWDSGVFKSFVFNRRDVSSDCQGFRISKCPCSNLLIDLMDSDIRKFLSIALGDDLTSSPAVGRLFPKGSLEPWSEQDEDGSIAWKIIVSSTAGPESGGIAHLAEDTLDRSLSDDYSLDGQISVSFPNLFNSLYLIPSKRGTFYRRDEVTDNNSVVTFEGKFI